MIFISLPNEAACQLVSRALWKLSVPPSRPRWDDPATTQFLVTWRKHPMRDEWVLEIPDKYELRIDPQTAKHLSDNDFGMRDELQALLQTRATNWLDLRNLIQTRASGTRTLVLSDDLIPRLLPALVRTQAQMDADGWFPALVTP